MVVLAYEKKMPYGDEVEAEFDEADAWAKMGAILYPKAVFAVFNQASSP